MLVGPSTAQGADTTLTLACQGTATDISEPVDGKPEPTSMGITINFTAGTVVGLDFPIKITSSDEAMVFFEGSADTERTFRKIPGRIDRVTGDLKAVSIGMNKQTFISLDVSYLLKCRPAQRMFGGSDDAESNQSGTARSRRPFGVGASGDAGAEM
jgi:hypothetical protein